MKTLILALLLTISPVLALADQPSDTAPTGGNVFQRKGFVYSEVIDYTCDYREVRQAIHVAENAALGDCYGAGFNQCDVTFEGMIANGVNIDSCTDLGRCASIELLWGCSARAVVKGQ